MHRWITLLTLLILLAGLTSCARFRTPELPAIPLALTAQQTASLVADLTEQLRRRFPPAQTELVFNPQEGDAVARSLEQALRQTGYAVQAEAASGALTLHYAAGELRPGQIIVASAGRVAHPPDAALRTAGR